jgi:hypothetical protein
LKKLILNDNQIESDGLIALASGLAENNTITVVLLFAKLP